MLWIRTRIRKDPKLFAGYGSGSGTGLEPYQKSSKKISNLIIMALKVH
jgi:hypothetical protein